MAIYKIKEIKDEEIKKCCICGEKIEGWGNNPWPIKEDGECCDKCNYEKVIPARIKKMYSTETTTKDISIEELSEEEKKAIDDYKKAISETNNPKLLDLFAHILKEETEHLEELQSQTAKDSVKDNDLTADEFEDMIENSETIEALEDVYALIGLSAGVSKYQRRELYKAYDKKLKELKARKDSVKDNDYACTDEKLREIHKKLHEMINKATLVMDPDSDMDLMTLIGDYGKIVYRLYDDMKNGNFELGDPRSEYASVSYKDDGVDICVWFDPEESKKKIFAYGAYTIDGRQNT